MAIPLPEMTAGSTARTNTRPVATSQDHSSGRVERVIRERALDCGASMTSVSARQRRSVTSAVAVPPDVASARRQSSQVSRCASTDAAPMWSPAPWR